MLVKDFHVGNDFIVCSTALAPVEIDVLGDTDPPIFETICDPVMIWFFGFELVETVWAPFLWLLSKHL